MTPLSPAGVLCLLPLLVPGVALQVILVVPNATVPEKAAFQLDCSIASRSSQDSRFAVAWFSLRTKVGGEKDSPGLAGQEEQDPTERTALLRVGHDAVFSPEGGPWEDRLRFQRPSLLLFRLTVLEASPQDTGHYSCRVEEWLPSPQGVWYPLTEEESAHMGICVLDTGSTLQSSICSNDGLFHFVCFYPFPIFGILIITILLVPFKRWKPPEISEGQNGVPLIAFQDLHSTTPQRAWSPRCSASTQEP